MATTERPKSRLDDGRVNPEYTAWRKKAAALKIDSADLDAAVDTIQPLAVFSSDEHPNQLPSGDPAPAADGGLGVDPVAVEAVAGGEDEPGGELREVAEGVAPALTDEFLTEVIDSLGEQRPIFEDPPEGATRTNLDAWIKGEAFQSAAEPEQTTNDDPREPEVAPALEPLKGGEVIEITVDRIARNKSFVYGALNGELVPIRVKKKTGPKLVGKPINVTVTVEAGHTLFTHTP